MKAPTIRLANITDMDTIFSIHTSVKENHLPPDQLADMGITYDAIKNAILAVPCTWMAEVDNYPVGFSMADLATGSIYAMFIRPTFEGMRLGRALMAKAESFLFQYHQKIWLETNKHSHAYGFYKKLSWSPVEELPNGDIRFEKLY